MKTKIGIARALYSFYNYPLWHKFFKELNCEITLSPPTTRKMLEYGTKIAPEEICLPIKAFLGHIEFLRNEVDCILVPRPVCMKLQNSKVKTKNCFHPAPFDKMNGDKTKILKFISTQQEKRCGVKFGCPKAIGLPDLVKATFSSLPQMIDLTIDERIISQPQAFLEIGRLFVNDNKKILEAWNSARIEQEKYDNILLQGIKPSEIFDQNISIENKPRDFNKQQIGLIGHPYLIYDNLLNSSLLDTIEKLNIDIRPVSSVCKTIIYDEMEKIPDVHWFYEQNIIGSTAYFLKQNSISGLIFVFSFACGTSAVVSEIIRKELLHFKDIPSLTLILDEHTAPAGLITRIESFIDLLTRKPKR